MRREKPAHERRRHVRYRVEARVRLMIPAFGTREALTRDISDRGVFVAAEHLPALPRGAHVELQLLDSAYPSIIFNTKVVDATVRGVALMFVDFELDGVRHTMEALQQYWQPPTGRDAIGT
ncbi:MAG: PilZ domain-containing protein [Pseudomonadota bacterium]|nr:MAG: PilZ domain-containing protein [Pseudomonadota bacterium]